MLGCVRCSTRGLSLLVAVYWKVILESLTSYLYLNRKTDVLTSWAKYFVSPDLQYMDCSKFLGIWVFSYLLDKNIIKSKHHKHLPDVCSFVYLTKFLVNLVLFGSVSKYIQELLQIAMVLSIKQWLYCWFFPREIY